MTDIKRPALVVCIVFVLVSGAMLLVGCGKDAPPPFVTTEQPVVPSECLSASPAIPKLPDADVDSTTAAKDRQQLVDALKRERSTRRACADRLRALFPQPEAKT